MNHNNQFINEVHHHHMGIIIKSHHGISNHHEITTCIINLKHITNLSKHSVKQVLHWIPEGLFTFTLRQKSAVRVESIGKVNYWIRVGTWGGPRFVIIIERGRKMTAWKTMGMMTGIISWVTVICFITRFRMTAWIRTQVKSYWFMPRRLTTGIKPLPLRRLGRSVDTL